MQTSESAAQSAPSRRHKANAIRALSMDAVQQAACGHPGMPMGMADIAEVLWCDHLRHNPGNPDWFGRDRFVLSNGHGSMLLYSLLHLTGYDLPMDEIRRFRQLNSMTPGHPEYGYAPGIETTTGPLGQGISNAVGMALAEKMLAGRFNRPGHEIIDHFTYVFLGDGCLMEGISHEACSFAGTFGLGKLIALWDDNGISIDGEVKGWFTDDTPARFRAYGWQVIDDVDGHDPQAVSAALEKAKTDLQRPTLICCRTVIGWGSPNKAGKAASHGAALGEDEVNLVREKIAWPHEPFHVPEDVYAAWNMIPRGEALESEWVGRMQSYRDAWPDLAAELDRRVSGGMPENWQELVDSMVSEVNKEEKKMATRQASQRALEGLGPLLPELVGGSADLTGSNLTKWSGSKVVSADDPGGNYLHFGVREFGMAAIINGMALHGGFIPYAATFLMFSEYARNALRMAALMKIRSIFVFTHDSIGLGEDGPTHQAVEQTATLRLMPNMSVWRPCDTVETAVAWKHAVERLDGPTSLLFSRQGVPFVARDEETLASIEKGGYVIKDCDGVPEAIIIATGSEVSLALEATAHPVLAQRRIRVVSMPCCDVFNHQETSYQDQVLPPQVRARVSVEAGVTAGWERYTGLDGVRLGVDTFGESAPAEELYRHFGLTASRIAESTAALLSGT